MKRFAVLTLFAVAASPDAAAVADYLDQIPARPAACQTCHVGSDDGALNPFGLETSATLYSAGITPTVNWSLLFNIDSDLDGQTNGQELGDPCGEWSGEGGPVRLYAISHPGMEDDLSTSPSVGCTSEERPFDTPSPRIYDPGVGGPAYDEGSSQSGCPAGGLSQTGEVRSDALLFGLLLFLVGRRHRRRRA